MTHPSGRRFVVRRGHARPLWYGDPWVHASAVDEASSTGSRPEDDVALVYDEKERFLGRGLLSPGSAIRIRLLDRVEEPQGVDDVLVARIREAAALRGRLFPSGETTAYRLVHAEGDFLPGLVVDRLANVLVAQFSTGPMFRRRRLLASALLEATGASTLVARPGGYEREEGIDAAEVLAFRVGEAAIEPVLALEAGMPIEAHPLTGQKTGHYADQRENRVHVAEVAADAAILDLFAGTGGFAIQGLRHGARSALAVDRSERALEAARRTADAVGVGDRLRTETGEVAPVLARLKEASETFDVVVLDPPSFFPRRGTARHALRTYRDLNVQALTRVRPGGILATFTCSARLSAAEFESVVVSAARECRRTLKVLRALTQGPDHPVDPGLSASRYLSGLLVQVHA